MNRNLHFSCPIAYPNRGIAEADARFAPLSLILSTMSSALILGSTGLCGSAILKYAQTSESFAKVITLTRSKLDGVDAKVEQVVDADSANWSKSLPNAQYVFSGIGTTKAAAGSFEKQYKIDHDLNLELAKAAKANGATTYVLVSSTGASANSSLAYLRMKGELEDAVKDLDFEKTIILRPGPLLGERTREFKGQGEGLFRAVGKWLHRSAFQRILAYPIYGDEVGQAAVKLATKLGPGFHIIEAKDLIPAADA